MQRALEDMHAEVKYNHLPYSKRVRMFLSRYKWKIFFAGLFFYLFNFWGNALGFASSRIEKSYRKYKKRWLVRYNPHCITYMSAIETTWEPKRLSRQSTERLSEAFVKFDREMEHGMSRQLILDTLRVVSDSNL
jgi:hypothetical protein